MSEATITSFESVRVRPYLSKRRLLANRLSINSQRVAMRSGVLINVAAISSEVVIVLALYNNEVQINFRG